LQDAAPPLDARLREDLHARRLLVVLDSFEHLLAAAPAVTGLLAACPNLSVLATSRAALGCVLRPVCAGDPQGVS
jgi:predicted ATPase